jgi:hypothetical protein
MLIFATSSKTRMTDRTPDALGQSQQHQIALSRWDNEGGAGPVEEIDGVLTESTGPLERKRRLTNEPIW